MFSPFISHNKILSESSLYFGAVILANVTYIVLLSLYISQQRALARSLLGQVTFHRDEVAPSSLQYGIWFK